MTYPLVFPIRQMSHVYQINLCMCIVVSYGHTIIKGILLLVLSLPVEALVGVYRRQSLYKVPSYSQGGT